MRRTRVDSPVATGQPLALDVVGRRGEVLVRAGAELTPRRQRLMAEHGATWCFVDDAAGIRLAAGPLVPSTLAKRCRAALRDLVTALEQRAGHLLRQPTPRVLESIATGGMAAPAATSGPMERLRECASLIANAAHRLDGRAGFPVDRHALDEMVGHPVNVAGLAAHIGVLVGFERRDVEATALAALLHDIGLVFVPEEVLDRPLERRSRAERHRYEDHAAIGEALLRRMLRDGYLPRVAGEHHEHQAGDGYPLRLTGGHRVLRDTDECRNAGRLSLVSEIVAVADRYERLSAAGPGFEGLPAWAARDALRSLAQHGALNAEVVERFIASIPVLPVGSEVRVSGGTHDGALAVVWQPSFADPHRPQVIVIEDAAGRRLEGLPLDLGAEGARAIWERVSPVAVAR